MRLNIVETSLTGLTKHRDSPRAEEMRLRGSRNPYKSCRSDRLLYYYLRRMMQGPTELWYSRACESSMRADS